MNVLKKIWFNARLVFNSLFYGMKAGNVIMQQKENKTGDDSDIISQKEVDSVLNDFVKGEETQRVKETRDEMYRVLRESENIIIEREDTPEGIILKPRKKTAADYVMKIKVYNPENLPVRLIQDNKFYEKGSSLFIEDLINGEVAVSIFTITRTDFIPRFRLEKYINKLVVRNIDNKHVYLDMYTTEYASQFGKVDALFIKQIYDIKKNDIKKSDITTIDKIEFITDKSTGENSLCKFEYNNIEFQYINMFDGNFVLTFKADIVIDGVFVGDKFKTKELDKKLKSHSKRDNVVGVEAGTLLRHIKQEKNNELPDYGTVTFKLEEE